MSKNEMGVVEGEKSKCMGVVGRKMKAMVKGGGGCREREREGKRKERKERKRRKRREKRKEKRKKKKEK